MISHSLLILECSPLQLNLSKLISLAIDELATPQQHKSWHECLASCDVAHGEYFTLQKLSLPILIVFQFCEFCFKAQQRQP